MKELCKKIIDRFKEQRILVIGDAILDAYIKGTTEKLCREAPAPVITIREQEYNCGGAANTAINAAALGGRVSLLTVIGRDANGRAMLKELSRHKVNTACIIRDKSRSTLCKSRITASDNILLRMDEGNDGPVNQRLETALCRQLAEVIDETDAIILSDYGYGIVTPALMKILEALRREKNIPLIIDSRQLQNFKCLAPTFVKPNYLETIALLGQPFLQKERVAQIRKKGKKLLEITGAQSVAVTMDREGVLLFEKGKRPFRIPCIPRDDKKAIGAGDTFISAAALALCSSADVRTASLIASHAAAIVIRKEDTGICTQAELRTRFLENPKYIYSLYELARNVEELKKTHKRIVFTNGCFDILHPGHVNLLNRAKALGDILIVGLNTDKSIRRLKGKGRPINCLEDRITVLAGFQSVNYLIAFKEDSPLRILKTLKPDIFVKGGSYNEEFLPEAALVKAMGGSVKILPLTANFSTTHLIEKIGAANGHLAAVGGILNIKY